MSVYAATVLPSTHPDALLTLLCDVDDLIDLIVEAAESGHRITASEVYEFVRAQHPKDVRMAAHRTVAGGLALTLASASHEDGLTVGDEVAA